jgi:hypothetical protein
MNSVMATISWFEFVVSHLAMLSAGTCSAILLAGWRHHNRMLGLQSTLKSLARIPRRERVSLGWQTRLCFAAATVATGLLMHAGPSLGADRLIDETRAVGQSDSHEECAAKLANAAATSIAKALSSTPSFAAEHLRNIESPIPKSGRAGSHFATVRLT